MAKGRGYTQFVSPHGEDGQFLPREEWSEKDIRRYERSKKRKAPKRNPLVNRKSNKRRQQKVWIPPQDPETGKFLPESEWSAAEKRSFKRALKEGKVPGAERPRNEKGQFVSTDPSRRRKKKAKQQPYFTEPASSTHDGYDDLHRDIRRVERMVEDVLREQRLDTDRDRVREVVVVPERRRSKNVERIVMLPEHEEQFDSSDFDIDEVGANGSNCPPCDFPGLERMRGDIRDVKQLLDSPEHRAALARNPRYRSNPLMYDIPKSVGMRIGSAIDFIKRKPLMMVLGFGAVMVMGYAVYRLIQGYRALRNQGVEIVSGSIYFPGVNPYVITQDDMLWMARSIWGEVNRDPSAWGRADVQNGAAAVLWAYANHYLTVGQKRSIFPTLGTFIQYYSQPINPRWVDPAGSKCQSAPHMCTASRVAFRRALRAKPWNELPLELRSLVERFVQGRVPNPIGTRTDFRAEGTNYTPLDRMVVAGNVFGTASNARARQEQVA